MQRAEIIDEANNRLNYELDLLKVLNKIRDNHQILKSLVSKKERNMMKIAKDRVIDPNNQFYRSEPNNDGALSSDISVDLGPDSERDEPPD